MDNVISKHIKNYILLLWETIRPGRKYMDYGACTFVHEDGFLERIMCSLIYLSIIPIILCYAILKTLRDYLKLNKEIDKRQNKN